MEKWRVITPILLALISAILSVNSYILAGMRGDITRVTDRLETHVMNQEIHYGLKKDIDWIKSFLSTKAWANDK